MSSVVVPPGQSPPFEVIDGDHRGGVIIIVAACALVLSLVAILIRVYVRLLLSPPFGLDDHVLVVATVGDRKPLNSIYFCAFLAFFFPL